MSRHQKFGEGLLDREQQLLMTERSDLKNKRMTVHVKTIKGKTISVMCTAGSMTERSDLKNKRMTVHVKTIKGKTISVMCTAGSMAVHMMQQIEKKAEIPKEQQHLVGRGRVLKDERKLKQYNVKDGETTELTMLLVGGTKRDETMPSKSKEEREAKRRTSEKTKDHQEKQKTKWNRWSKGWSKQCNNQCNMQWRARCAICLSRLTPN